MGTPRRGSGSPLVIGGLSTGLESLPDSARSDSVCAVRRATVAITRAAFLRRLERGVDSSRASKGCAPAERWRVHCPGALGSSIPLQRFASPGIQPLPPVRQRARGTRHADTALHAGDRLRDPWPAHRRIWILPRRDGPYVAGRHCRVSSDRERHCQNSGRCVSLDPCCTSAPQSTAQEIHNVAGGVHYFTLSIAALMWTVAARQIFGRRSGWFRWYSLTSVVLAIASPSVLMWAGAATSADVGLFQRVSFGLLNLWIFVFAALTWSRPAMNAVGPVGSSR